MTPAKLKKVKEIVTTMDNRIDVTGVVVLEED